MDIIKLLPVEVFVEVLVEEDSDLDDTDTEDLTDLEPLTVNISGVIFPYEIKQLLEERRRNL